MREVEKYKFELKYSIDGVFHHVSTITLEGVPPFRLKGFPLGYCAIDSRDRNALGFLGKTGAKFMDKIEVLEAIIEEANKGNSKAKVTTND